MDRHNTPVVDMPALASGPALSAAADISITKIQIPLTVTIAAFIVVLGGVISFTIVWARTSDHVANEHVHINETKATEGGGIAYRKDVEIARTQLDDRITQESKRTRKLMRKLTLDCRKQGDGMSCRVKDLPEDAE